MRTLLMLALSTFAFAQISNYSGKWMLEQPGRSGRPQQAVLILNQVGNEVTGSVEARFSDSDGSPVNRDILAGKVDGGALSFYIWTGQDKPTKSFYTGTISGDTINFTISAGPSGTPSSNSAAPRQLVARRTK